MKTVLTLLFAVVTALSIVGCRNEPPAGTMRYIAFRVYDPVYIAYEKGFFEKRGISVEIIDLIAGGPVAIQAVAGGSAEAGLSSIMAIISARSQGLPIIGVSDIQSAIGNQALQEFFVRADSGIYSVADLRGRTIAINLVRSSFHYTLLMALEAVGLSESDVNFIILPFDQQVLALVNGSVDVIGLMQPHIRNAAERPYLKRLFTTHDVFGNKQFTLHFLNYEWAQNNEKTATAFVAAIADAAAWIENNQDAAREIIARHTGVDIRFVENYYFQPNAMVVLEDAQIWLDYMRAANEITADWLQVSDFATNRFNPFVMED